MLADRVARRIVLGMNTYDVFVGTAKRERGIIERMLWLRIAWVHGHWADFYTQHDDGWPLARVFVGNAG